MAESGKAQIGSRMARTAWTSRSVPQGREFRKASALPSAFTCCTVIPEASDCCNGSFGCSRQFIKEAAAAEAHECLWPPCCLTSLVKFLGKGCFRPHK